MNDSNFNIIVMNGNRLILMIIIKEINLYLFEKLMDMCLEYNG